MGPTLSRNLNALGLISICGVLLAGYYLQFARNELPCPLCLLQRVGMIAAAFGLALNVLYGVRPVHYAIVLLGAIYGGWVSARQILLHIVPGTGTYGSPIFGLHYYTWAGIVFFVIVAGTALMLLFDRQYENWTKGKERAKNGPLEVAAMALFLFVTLANAISTFIECGIDQCPANPTGYLLLD